MLKNVFAIKDCNSIILNLDESSTDVPNLTQIVTFLSVLRENGYVLSENSTNELFTKQCSLNELKNVLDAIVEVRGSNVAHNMIISNFPDVTRIDNLQKRVASFFNYFTGLGLKGDYAELPLNKSVKYIVLDIVPNVDKEIAKLFISKLPLKLDHEQLISSLYEQEDKLISSIDHKEIVLKEILARHIAYGFKNGINGIARSSTDILRAIAIHSGEDDAKLDTKFKIAPLSNPMRRAVISELNRVATITDLTGHKEMFKHLFKALHIHSKKYSGINEEISKLAKELQVKNNPKTDKTFLHGIVSFGMDNISDLLFKEIVSKNPSWFARQLDSLIRKNPTRVELILESLIENAEKINSKIITQLLGHFASRGEDITERAFSLKGVSGGVKIVSDKPLLAMDEKLLVNINDVLINALRKIYLSSDTVIEHALIDKALYKINVPSNMSANDSAKAVSRGSRVDIELSDVLRLFVHWKSNDDLDISCMLLDEELKTVDLCAFYNLQGLNFNRNYTHSAEPYLIHSGDVRCAPNGGSEFIDIHLNKVPKNVRYIVMHVNSWTGRDCSEIDELFAGYMNRDSNDNGQVYEPKTVEDKFSLTGAIKSITPFYIDLKTSEMVWVDDKGSLGKATTVENLVIFKRLLQIADMKKMSIGELIEMHSKNVVTQEKYDTMTDIEKSEVTVFTKDFAYDVTEINSKYI